jgi:hypothetical protein
MQAARELLGPILGRNRQFLYLMNISALNLVNRGDLEGALRIEKEIEAESSAFTDRDYRFEYVNSINLARLYRRRNQFDLADEYYQRAFSTTCGARTESDLVYTNVCRARLDTARGRTFDAFHAWLRAALHWLASDVPEAIGWRVLTAILGRKALPATTPTEQVAGTLAGLLCASAESAGVELPSAFPALSPPAFVRAGRALTGDAGAVIRSAEAIGAPGLSVLATEFPIAGAWAGPCHDALAALVAALLASVTRVPEVITCPAILVDDGLGREMAVTRGELIAACLRLQIERARFDGQTCVTAGATRIGLPEDACVARGPAVSRVESFDGGGLVHFKRYLPPLSVDAADAAMLEACRGPVPLSELCHALGRPFANVLSSVRALETARALQVTWEAP